MASSSECIPKDPDDSIEEFTPKSQKQFLEYKKKQSVQYTKESLLQTRFYSDAEVDEFMENYQKQTGTNYHKRDMKPKVQLKDVSRNSQNDSLSSRYIRFSCIHGKRREEPMPLADKKRKTYTSCIGCSGEICLSLSKDGAYYFVSKFVDHDKHKVITRKASRLIKQNRKLNPEQKKAIDENMQKGGSKLKLIANLHKQGTMCSLRDISNVQSSIRKHCLGDSIAAVVDVLKKFNATYEVKVNQRNEFNAILFETPEMSLIFESWSEFCLIDFTYNLVHLDFPVGLINVIDGNGCTQLVCVCIVDSESKENIAWFLHTFKTKHLEACRKIKSFMGDKDATIRDCVKNEFAVPMYVCSFHAAQIFKRTITTDSMNISKEDRDIALNLLEKIMYATSEKSYVQLYDEFCSTVSASVRAYYDENWHTMKSEWVRGFLIESNFMNNTNNRNESLNGKIKLFCDKLNFLADFVNELLTFVLDVHQNERDIKAAENYVKVPAYKLTKDQELYLDYVTRYAFDLIEKEISEIAHVQNFTVENQEMRVFTKLHVFKYLVTPLSCTCKYFVSMGLPCRHIFKFREYLNLSLFDERLVLIRWTNDYYSNHPIFQENDSITEAANSNFFPERKINVDVEEVLNVEPDVVNNNSKTICNESFTSVVGNSPHEVINQSSQSIVKNDLAVKRIMTVDNDKGSKLSTINEVEITSSINEDAQVETSQSSVVCNTQPNLCDLVDVGDSCNNAKKNETDVEVKNIVVVKRSNRKGRCKGSKLTAFGIPKKNSSTLCNNTVRRFVDKTEVEKVLYILTPVVRIKSLKKIKKGIVSKISIADLKGVNVPSWFYNEEIKFDILIPYMESDAFNKLKERVDKNRNSNVWLCDICYKNVDESITDIDSVAVMCDACLNWFHSECLQLTVRPSDVEPFFCIRCAKD